MSHEVRLSAMGGGAGCVSVFSMRKRDMIRGRGVAAAAIRVGTAAYFDHDTFVLLLTFFFFFFCCDFIMSCDVVLCTLFLPDIAVVL
jgi:hypothetical protein